MITSSLPTALAILLASTSALACTGVIGGAPSAGDDDLPDDLVPPDCTDLGPPMLRRLTNLQLHRTLVAAFGDPGVPAGDVLTDPVVDGFQVDATAAVIRDLDAQQIMAHAERVADWAVEQRLGSLAACDTTLAACRRQFVVDLGARLHRQPLADATIEAYLAIVDAEPSFADGARAVIAAMVQSPYVLYRRELGEPDPARPGERRLTPLELASSLSYFLTDGPPDGELAEAAAGGRLATVEDLEREARRLLGTPEAAATLSHFVRGWLEISDLEGRARIDPSGQLTPEIRLAMLAETDALFVAVLRSGGTIGELFSAPYTFVAPALAAYYGLAGGDGDDVREIALPVGGTRAPGLLGHGGVLTRHALADSSSPVQRGKLVRERLLCQELTPPPPGTDTDLGPPDPSLTTRQRYQRHSVDPSCSGCHQLTDPIGFAFERFDGLGRHRDQDNGQPIDATGTLSGMPGGDVPLDGLDSLGDALAGLPAVDQCVARRLSYFAFGLEGCSEEAIRADVEAAGGSLEGAILAIVRAPQFSRRTDD